MTIRILKVISPILGIQKKNRKKKQKIGYFLKQKLLLEGRPAGKTQFSSEVMEVNAQFPRGGYHPKARPLESKMPSHPLSAPWHYPSGWNIPFLFE